MAERIVSPGVFTRERDLSFRRILGSQIMIINEKRTTKGIQCLERRAKDR